MSVEQMLIGLRVVSGGALMLFLVALAYVLWRDYWAVAQSVGSRTHQRGQLIVVQGNPEIAAVGAKFPLFPLTSIGRGPTNTLILEDQFASNEHTLLTWRNGQWWAEDRGSVNGTLLNGDRLDVATVISTGDILTIGQTDLRVELEPSSRTLSVGIGQ